MLTAFLAADLVVLVDALVERGFEAARVLLAVRPRAEDFGLSAFLAAGVTGFAGVVAAALAGVSAFLAGVAVLLATRTSAREGVAALTLAALGGLEDRVGLGGEATASAAFFAAALFGFGSAFLTGVEGSAAALGFGAAFFFPTTAFLGATSEVSAGAECLGAANLSLTISVLIK